MKHAIRNAPRNSRVNSKSRPGLSFGKRIREGAFILTSAISLFLLLALCSYHATDPAWSHTTQSVQVMNLGGKAGAYATDILLYFFGSFAYLFPFMLFYAAWLYFRHRNDTEPDYYFTLLRSAGFILILLAGTGFISLHFSMNHHASFASGGIIGTSVGLAMTGAFGGFGASLILFACFLCGVTLFTGLSWLKAADLLGAGLLVAASAIYLKLRGRGLQPPKLNTVNSPEPKRVEPRMDAKRIEPKFDLEPKLIVQSKSTREPLIAIDSRLSADQDVALNKTEVRIPEGRMKEKSEPAAPVIIKPSKNTNNKQENQEQQIELFGSPPKGGALPPLSLLDLPDKTNLISYSNQQLEEMSREVELRLRDFGIDVKVVAVHPGPVVTRFELQLAAGTKVSRISVLAKDLARSLSVISVRVVEIIPGKSVIGLELPNLNREVVRLREILASQQYENARSPLTLALGKDIAGHPVIVDIAKMPHLLVAGTTGSGKSVGLNGMLLSLLYKTTPDELRLILVDPKMLELSIYAGIPHLLTPVVTDMKEAANALRWCVAEMDRRYKLMASLGVRNIFGYNMRVREAIKNGTPLPDPLAQNNLSDAPQTLTELPYIVVLIDEFADMMMVVGKKVEELIARVAQKARAAGIHLILATQRPSVDVITGLIKANIPTRIAFQVSSKIDSRTILDQSGAEQLLGHGDMLYLAPGTGVPVRVHGAFVADEEVHRVVEQLKRSGEPNYRIDILTNSDDAGDSEGGSDDGNSGGEQDPLYDQAAAIVIESRRASISLIQRRLKIGYNRAANIMEAMEKAGLVSSMETNGSREVLSPAVVD